MQQYDAIIIGGGLAGLSAAIHLSLGGKSVLVLEKHAYPRHKVCGEYLSNEVLPYLQDLGVSLEEGVPIRRMEIGDCSGRRLEVVLPLGGIGISRYCLDHLLFKRALQSGVTVVTDSAMSYSRGKKEHQVHTTGGQPFQSRILIGAYGKRSGLDRVSERDFMKRAAPWLAVKAHYSIPAWSPDLVGLYPFPGGYAGLSATESGAVNLCYLTRYDSFARHPSVPGFNQYILKKNPFLKEYLTQAEMRFTQPLCIAQIAFAKKKTSSDGILYCGDAAGLIHPLSGNGMAMAIHSAKILSGLVLRYFDTATYTFEMLERDYKRKWNHLFSGRMTAGRVGQAALLHPATGSLGMAVLAKFPGILRSFISYTHGSRDGF